MNKRQWGFPLAGEVMWRWVPVDWSKYVGQSGQWDWVQTEEGVGPLLAEEVEDGVVLGGRGVNCDAWGQAVARWPVWRHRKQPLWASSHARSDSVSFFRRGRGEEEEKGGFPLLRRSMRRRWMVWTSSAVKESWVPVVATVGVRSEWGSTSSEGGEEAWSETISLKKRGRVGGEDL